MPGTDGLRATLEQLPLQIDDIDVTSAHVDLASYPDGPRPTSTIRLSGASSCGYGEHVGWTAAEHEAFRRAAAGAPCGSWRVGEWAARLCDFPAYDRAALEAAAIDLALRQRGTSLLELAGVAPQPVRYVVSFASHGDPVAEAEQIARAGIELKIDADPRWTDETWRRLDALERVTVIDFKLQGEAADHERACRHVRNAWIEDPRPTDLPWSSELQRRFSADAAITSLAALATLAPVPAAVNVKPARMGGVLEAIECLEFCRQRAIQVYIGGMFEVGIGRALSLVLASLACPDAPNDIAPLLGEGSLPARLRFDASTPGLAGNHRRDPQAVGARRSRLARELDTAMTRRP